MNSWFIKDQEVVDLLIKNGFTCEHPKATQTGMIQFHLRSKDDDKNWYETNCPLVWGGQYTLPDGNIIKSNGTGLALANPT